MWRIKRESPRCYRHLLAAVFFTLAAALTTNCVEITDFISENVLSDGEVETRVFYRGVSAKETSVGRGSTSGIKFRQLTDGKHFIQLIYDEDDQLRDCEFGHQKDQIKSFLSNFKSDLNSLLSTSNITIESLDGRSLPAEIDWLEYPRLRDLCHKKHREIKRMVQVVKEEGRNQSATRSRVERSLLIVPGTLWCGDDHNADTYTQLGGLSTLDKCCRRHDHCKRNIPSFTRKYHYLNLRPFTLSLCRCDRRSKRDISDIFRVPGTKWCGKGYSADKYTRLGGFSRTDRCCRRHDLSCPFWIGGFSTKYGLFNWRVNTLMHCNCDERFRACLKMVGSSDANLVGKLFFNVVQSKCFVLKPKKKCLRYSWWNKCEKYKVVKQAVIRDNLPY